MSETRPELEGRAGGDIEISERPSRESVPGAWAPNEPSGIPYLEEGLFEPESEGSVI